MGARHRPLGFPDLARVVTVEALQREIRLEFLTYLPDGCRNVHLIPSLLDDAKISPKLAHRLDRVANLELWK